MPSLNFNGRYVLNKNIGQAFSLSALFLGPKFSKNLGFSQSKHCE
jgi:hypothetical protein